MSLKENLYTFSVLQYRHDPWIGEAMNVGVLLSAPEVGFLKMRVRTASPRLTHAYPELGANDFRMLVRSLEKKVASLGQSLQHRSFFDRNLSSDIVAKRLLPDDDSALQWRKPGAGITSSPDEELERIFSRYVTRWDPSSPRDNRSDEDVYATFQRKLKYAPAKLVFEEKTIKTPASERSASNIHSRMAVYMSYNRFHLISQTRRHCSARQLKCMATSFGSEKTQMYYPTW